MSELLIKLFVKDYENTQSAKVRNAYGVLSGMVGIVLNIILSVFKIIFGKLTGSISIIADGANNFFDAGSSVINLAGFKISGKPADKDHPFGHGRIEYVSALSLAFLIIVMAVELFKSSFDRFSGGEAVTFSVPAAVVLVCSILGKMWLAYFNSKVGKRINSVAVDAVVKDSIGDIAATTASLIALVASKFTALPVDAFMGCAVALLVLFAGIGIIKDTMGPMLGEPPPVETVRQMEELVMSFDGILGIHDLVVHTYGTSRIFASLHAEVDSAVDVLVSHDIIDNAEKAVLDKLGIEVTIHLDPINTSDERVSLFREETAAFAKQIDEKLTVHDFRIVEGPTHINLIFDVVLPFDVDIKEEELKTKITAMVKEKHPDCFTVITVDRSYV